MMPPVSRRGAGITLAVVEVEVICRVLGVALPAGIEASLTTHEAWTASLACLVARGIVSIGAAGRPDVHPAVAATVRLAAMCRDRVEVTGTAGETFLAMCGDPGAVGVVLRQGTAGVVRLEPLRRKSPGHTGPLQVPGSIRSQREATPSASMSAPTPE